MTIVNMRERRTWRGGKSFEIDDTAEKPKTFREREEEAIFVFFWATFRWTLIPGAAVGLFYTWCYFSLDGEVWHIPAMTLGIMWILNVPNFGLAVIRGIALWIATYGRD